MAGRVTQEVVEAAVLPTSESLRVTQEVVEAVVFATSELLRVTQLVVEVLIANPVDIFPAPVALTVQTVQPVLPPTSPGANQALEYASYFGPHRHAIQLGRQRGIQFARRS